jgi:hypothetical protein
VPPEYLHPARHPFSPPDLPVLSVPKSSSLVACFIKLLSQYWKQLMGQPQRSLGSGKFGCGADKHPEIASLLSAFPLEAGECGGARVGLRCPFGYRREGLWQEVQEGSRENASRFREELLNFTFV